MTTADDLRAVRDRRMRWSIYLVSRHGGIREFVALGYVNAKHQPDAIRRAAKRWPKERDDWRTQFGFHAVPYVNDPFSLGRNARRAIEAEEKG